MSAGQDWAGLDPTVLEEGLCTTLRLAALRIRGSPVAQHGCELRDDQADVARDLARFVEERAGGLPDPTGKSPFGRIVLPPRTGKTVIAAHLLQCSRLHGLFLVPTRTLVHQTVRELRARAPGVQVGAFFGEEKDVVPDGVNVATYALVQRAWERGELPLAVRTAAVVFADEGHRAMTPARMGVLENAFLPSAIRIALTATPDYDAERTLCRFFPHLIHEMTLEEAMDGGLLAPLRVWVAEVDADASTVRIVAGDYHEHELGDIMSATPFFDATRAFRYGGDNAQMPALIACTTRQQARDLGAYLARHRPPGTPSPALVLGETPRTEREAVLSAFRDGQIDTIVQVGVLIEGWNAPECKLLIDLAPSLSRVRATQKFFRVMTKHGAAEARIFVILPAGLPCIPILPMELFGRSADDYECGTLISEEAPGAAAPRPLVPRIFDGVAGVSVVQRILLAESLDKPRLDPARMADVARVLESCPTFDHQRLPSLSTFQSLFFDHPLFLGRGSSLLRWLGVAPTSRAYAQLIARVYPEAAATRLLMQAGGALTDWPSTADAQYLVDAIATSAPGGGGLAEGWRALTGGDEAPETPEEILLAREGAESLRDLVDGLHRRDRYVVTVAFGLARAVDAREDGASLAELGDALEVSRSRAGQLVRRALAKLARHAALQARNAGESPTTWWERRPSSAAGLLRTMVPHGEDGFRYFAALAGATEEMVVWLVSDRADRREAAERDWPRTA